MGQFKGILLFIALMCLTHCSFGANEMIGLLDNYKDLTGDEIKALLPLFEQLQLQYDLIMKEANKEDVKVEGEFAKIYEATIKEFDSQFASFMDEDATTVYDTSLPTVEDIMGKPDWENMTPEQRDEFLDIQSILQDTLDETKEGLNELVARAVQIEAELIKINKPKIVMGVLNGLSAIYKVASRVGRASYCTYSHMPQLNASLHQVYDGVDCYLLTTSLIVRIQNEIYDTVKVLRKTISDLAVVYKKVANKNTLMGKIVSMIMNMKKVTWSVFGALRQAHDVIGLVVTQLPETTSNIYKCGTNMLDNVPFIVETVSNVTECITFVDNSKPDYGFLDPENSTRIPELYPDPESGETDSDESWELF
ncbi:uncharacterized protein LOC106093452 [Stomoxys calcitrans]|uniref:uncharacterized protein LOC106093452 n=1 Tax=Stomoxys calcitrans TaxID=35570 RepID=UPI0027E2B0F4|nr:uncharacterized protein LOC106093452 [Stomoxys calcitrans]